MKQPSKLLLIVLVCYGVAIALLPYALEAWFNFRIDPRKTQGPPLYPWNFSPLAAISLFAAAHMRDWRKAILIPLCIRGFIDLGIWAIKHDINLVWYPDQVYVYMSVLLFTAVGVLLRYEKSPLYLGSKPGSVEWAFRIGMAGFVSELLFFIVTNYATWELNDTYPHTAAGLQQCFIMALPFFGRSLASTLFYSGVLFGGYAWHEHRAAAKDQQLTAHQVE